jgi:hypothetical protein
MKSISIFSKLLFLLAFTAPAQAQKPTFYTASIALAAAATPTDIFCLNGAANTVARVKQIAVAGTASSAGQIQVLLIKRASLNTGGTLATGLAAPAAVRADIQGPPAAVTPIAWTANPTLGAFGGVIAGVVWNITTNGSSANPSGSSSGTFGDDQHEAPHVRSGEALCINFNSTAVTGMSVDIGARWTESNN